MFSRVFKGNLYHTCRLVHAHHFFCVFLMFLRVFKGVSLCFLEFSREICITHADSFTLIVSFVFSSCFPEFSREFPCVS